MARRHRLSRNPKSTAGMTLIGLGLFILFGNLTDPSAQLSRLTGISADATQTFGELTAVGLAGSQALQCLLFDRAGFARGVCKILISLWPLLLVIAGTFLTGTGARTESRNFQKRI
jgi:hypothetical protein